MQFGEFLNRINFSDTFEVLNTLPMEIFFNGIKQDSIPYPSLNFDTTSRTRLAKFLMGYVDEDKDNLSVEMRFGYSNVSIFVSRNVSYRDTRQLVLSFS